jgi:hypothetical protein
MQSLLLRWFWPLLAGTQVAIGVVGFRRTLANPDLVDIPIFTDLLTNQGISRVTLIWALQVLPWALAVVAALWIYFGTHHTSFPLWFGLGLISLYLFQGGVGQGLVEAWGLVGSYVDTVLLAFAILVFFLFPNGQWQPRWARWVFPILVVPLLVDPALAQDTRRMLAGPDTVISGSRLPGILSLISLFALLVAVQVIRYVRHSSSVERLQTKWVLLGGVLWSIPAVLAIAMVLAGFTGQPVGLLLAVTAFASYLIPVACAVAITKHRLYDLGRVVSRTVTYSVVAGFVGLLYVAGVGLMRFLFPLSGSLAVAASTLAAVALISPLHRRVRDAVDRRFNRARYDAQVESAAFANRLQSALDFDELVADMVEVLKKTVQPATAAIWTSSLGRPAVSDMPRPAVTVDSPPGG